MRVQEIEHRKACEKEDKGALIIELRDVSFTYQESKEASLEHIDLAIREGEVVVLCGESGCGKSTVLRLINGLIPFYQEGELKGEVRVLGQETKQGSIYDLGNKVSTVFQNPKSQFFCVDVKSELAFAAENRKLDKEVILERIEETCRELSCEHLLERTMFQLSGGEKQKIACASVMVTDNPIIVLDEPSSNLDLPAIEELKKILLYWKEKGKTIIIAEHRLQYLQDVADRFVYLKAGKIIASLTGKELKKLPAKRLAGMGLRSLSYDSLPIENNQRSEEWITLRDCSFSYKGRSSYRERKKPSLSVDKLSLPKGAVIAIVGRNGAGKSTFARCICGLEHRAKGFWKDGKKEYRMKKLLDASFMVMQDVNHQLFTESVEEELLLSKKKEEQNRTKQSGIEQTREGQGRTEETRAEQNKEGPNKTEQNREAQTRQGQAKAEQNRMEAIEKELDLYAYRKRHPMSLSGGQKQRVAVACAVCSGRSNIIFDEPTSGLDYFHMRQVAEGILQLQKEQKTIFLITHDIELIYACCNYVLRMENGSVKEGYWLEEDKREELLQF